MASQSPATPPILPRVHRVLRIRRLREVRRSPSKWTVFLLWSLMTLAATSGVVLALGILVQAQRYQVLTQNLPPVTSILRWLDPAQGLFTLPTRLEDRRGDHVWGDLLPPDAQKARYASWGTMSEPLRQALMAVLDPAFWPQEPPPDPALDLANTFLLTREPPGPQHEARIRWLAQEMTLTYPRHRLLEWWANTRHFGPGLYGVDAAAWAFFGKSSRELNWSEAILLAVMARWPQARPWQAKTWTQERYQALVEFLFRQGKLAAEERLVAQQVPDLAPPGPLHQDPWRAWWMQEWLSRGSPPTPARGRVVRTTVERDFQQGVECLLRQAYGQSLEDCPALPPWPLEPLPPDLEVEAVVLDPATGEVLALTFPPSQSAPQARPLGTGLGPWLYAAAFSRGWGPATLLWDVPASLGPSWAELTNHDGRFHGPLQAGPALNNGYEVPLALLIDRFGPLTLVPTLETLGFPTTPDELMTAPLGEGPHRTLLQVAHGLSLFAALGQWSGREAPTGLLRPVLFLEARAWDGQPETLPPRSRQLRLSPALAYLTTYSLAHPGWRQGLLREMSFSRPTALYLGRAAEGRVLWMLGYSASRVVALVVDARRVDRPSPELETYTLTLWRQVYDWAHQDLPITEWPRPAEVTIVRVCVPSGLLPTEDCPLVEEMPFLKSNVPLHADTLYRRFFVNTQTGRLATVLSPPAWVEERVYLMYPPEARAWAQEAGKPLPPTEYDTLRLPSPSPDAQITQPVPFGYVSGKVVIRGTANVPDFQSYRLQVGKGLYPKRWQVIAEGSRPVTEGSLGEWDTTADSPGLYILQLQVVDRQGRLYTHTLQVTVDHQAPEVVLWAPRAGGLPSSEEGYIVFSAQVRDDYALAEVRFLLDGEEIARFLEGPYRLAYPVPPGEHRFQVVAIDAAGNRTTEEVVFQVP